MIPRIIHYCWFGGKEKPPLAQKCIDSWRLYCPDYQIVEWNESSFDVFRHPYLRWCFEQKKWAFLSDFARLLILRDHGGIYLDTDVEVVRPLDDLLAFDAFYGFETEKYINTGEGFGCVPNHPTVEAMIKLYQALTPDENGGFPDITCSQYNTRALLPYGLLQNGERQNVLGAEILPADYLNPYDNPTGILRKTENTYSIHWYGKSWMNKTMVLKSRLMQPLHRVFGKDFILFRIMRIFRIMKFSKVERKIK